MCGKSRVGITAVVVIFFLVIAGTEALSTPDFSGTSEGLKGEIAVLTSQRLGDINPDICGLFVAIIFHQFDGGMWAEMLRSRKFAEDDGGGENYGVVEPWFAIGRNEKTHFAHDNTIFYSGRQSQKIISEDPANQRTGIGQGGLCLQEGKGYEVRVNLMQKDIQGPVVVTMEGRGGVYARREVAITGTDWNRFSFIFKPTQTDKDGKFTITFAGSGTLWVGTASLMPDDNISGYRRDVIDAIEAICPPIIRWPGGCNVDCYYWQDGIGDRDRRPARYDKAFLAADEWISNDVGTDELMKLCRLTGAKPYVIVNAGEGSAEDAAALVEYCNGRTNTRYGKLRAENGHPEPYNIRIWGLGNELFGNWEIGHTDAETYARKCVAFAKAMRAVDKDIKLVACGGRYWKFPRWNQAIFKIAGEYVDYLSLHSYAKKYRSTLKKEDLKDLKRAEEIYYYLASSPYGVEEQIIETDREIRAALPNRPDFAIAFDEWNAHFYRAGPYEELEFAQREAVYAAGMLHAFRRQHKAVAMANIWGVVNANPMIRVKGCDMFFNPQYLIFKMYSGHSGPSLLATAVKCDSYPAPEYEKGRPQAKGHIPYLDVSATTSSDGKTLYLAVINLHADKNLKTQITFDKWDFSSQVKTFELHDDDYMTENTFEQPDRITIKEAALKDISNPFSYTFKPHSVTIMEFGRK